MTKDYLTLQDEKSIAQLRYWLNGNLKYNRPLKVLPVLVCMKNTALRDVSQEKCSTWLHLVLYLSLNMSPHAVFSVRTCRYILQHSVYDTQN